MEFQKKLVEEIPRGRYIVLEDMSHVLHLEKPEPIIDTIKEMISEMRERMK